MPSIKDMIEQSILKNVVICYIQGKYFIARKERKELDPRLVPLSVRNIGEKSYKVYYDFLDNIKYSSSLKSYHDLSVVYNANIKEYSVIPYLSDLDKEKLACNNFKTIDLVNLCISVMQNNDLKKR